MMYRSDWSFEFRALKKTFSYSKPLRLVLYIVPFALFVYAYGLAYLFEITKSFTFTMVATLPIVLFVFLRLRPKIYSVNDRGIVIDGTIHQWKNFRGYFVDGEDLCLKPYIGMIVVLPKEFEPVVSKYLKKIVHRKNF